MRVVLDGMHYEYIIMKYIGIGFFFCRQYSFEIGMLCQLDQQIISLASTMEYM